MRVGRRYVPNRTATSGVSGRIWELRADVAGSLTAVGGSLTTGALISQWNDQSSTALHPSQGTTAKQPTYNATALNGKPSIIFNRANITELSAASSLWTGDPDFTVFFVGFVSDTSFSTFFSTGVSTALHAIALALNYGNTGKVGINTNTANAQFSANVRANAPLLVRVSKASGSNITNAKVYQKGVGPASLSTNTPGVLNVTAGTTKIGTNITSVSTTYSYNGGASHLLVVNRVVPDLEASQIEAGLMQAWF